MKLKKLTALGCAGMLLASMAGNVTTVMAEDEVETIVFAFPVVQTVDMDQIEEALNEITEERIGVHVELEALSASSYANQIGLMMSGGEQLDVIGFMGDYSQMVSKNQFLAMNDYLDEYASGAVEAIGEEFLKATTTNGNVYAFPTLNGKASVNNIVLRKDLIEELDLPVDELVEAETFEDYCANLDLLDSMFEKIHEAHPELAVLVPSSTNPNTLTFDYKVPFVDMLTDGLGVLLSDDTETVVDLYESEEFSTLVNYAYEWNQKGYVLADASTTQESYTSYIKSGRAAGCFIEGEEGQDTQIITATGVDVGAYKLTSAYISTDIVNGMGFAVAATSTKPEAAVKFLNALYTDADVVNLFDWGIEGTHYVFLENGNIGYPEGVDANTTTYGLGMDWYFGNQFLEYTWGEDTDPTLNDRLQENNKTAEFSPAMGFSFDSSAVSTEIAALSNVTSQYLPGLLCGATDPETELPKFIEALNSAGLEKVIEEKQSQYDTWREAQQ